MILYLFFIFLCLHTVCANNNEWACHGYKCSIHYKLHTLRANNITMSNYVEGSGTELWYITKDFSNIVITGKNPVCVLQFNAFHIVGNFSEKNINVGKPFITIMSKNKDFLYLPLLQHYANQIIMQRFIKFNVPLTRMRYFTNHSYASDNIIKKTMHSLGNLSILGDWARGHETIGFGNIQFFC